jgi:hypothetical protein
LRTGILRTIAVYELASAAAGVYLLSRSIGATNGAAAWILILTSLAFTLLSVAAGIMLWRGTGTGIRLTKISQWSRLFRFATPWVSYYAFLGLDLNVGVQFWMHGIPGIGPDANGINLWLGANVIAILQFMFLRPAPFFGFGINLLALAILWALRVPKQARAAMVSEQVAV